MTTESDSLFYNADGTSWSDYIDTAFVPNFNPCDTPDLLVTILGNSIKLYIICIISSY